MVDRLAVVRLIEQAVDLGRRRLESPTDLSNSEPTGVESSLGPQAERVQKLVALVVGVPVIGQDVGGEHPSPGTGAEHVDDTTVRDLSVDQRLYDGIASGRSRCRERVREGQALSARQVDLEEAFPVVQAKAEYVHSMSGPGHVVEGGSITVIMHDNILVRQIIPAVSPVRCPTSAPALPAGPIESESMSLARTTP